MNPAEAYIINAPQPFQSIMMELQSIVEKEVPDATLLYKWSLPFYFRNDRMFCFLNYRKKFVDLGIPKGHVLQTHQDLLIAGEGRKSLRSLRFYKLEDVDPIKIAEVLLELKQL